jgi:hypothetical protein
MIQEGGARICTYMRSKVQSVRKRDKGPMAGRKYILGSRNGVWKWFPESRDDQRWVQSPERSESPYNTLLRVLTAAIIIPKKPADNSVKETLQWDSYAEHFSKPIPSGSRNNKRDPFVVSVVSMVVGTCICHLVELDILDCFYCMYDAVDCLQCTVHGFPADYWLISLFKCLLLYNIPCTKPLMRFVAI